MPKLWHRYLYVVCALSLLVLLYMLASRDALRSRVKDHIITKRSVRSSPVLQSRVSDVGNSTTRVAKFITRSAFQHNPSSPKQKVAVIQREPKIILFYNTFFGRPDFDFGLGTKPFISAGCPQANCLTTSDKRLFDKSAAVVFHMRNVQGVESMPKKRLPHQRWVFFLMEHPYHQWNAMPPFNGMFNLTMTYRHDSDVKLLYGKVTPRLTTETFTGQLPSKGSIKGKSKLVAWFVSNCNTHNNREKYVEELKKYIPVDVYGKCGTLKCPLTGNPQSPHKEISCYKMLNSTYKFYLSFENIFCKDYVTEKLFNILQIDVIPVVLGGTNYTRDAPPHSIINVQDFKNPEALAKRLKELDKNDEEYLSYFNWRKKYKVSVSGAYSDAFCDLCSIVNNASYPSKVYTQLDQWWNPKADCTVKPR